jgi:hypothetical protein
MHDDGLGLIAKWSKHFGYVSIHDPILGEWWDVAFKEAPEWALDEARRRKELWRAGRRDAYTLNPAQMEELWQAKQSELSEADEGIVEDHPLPE